MVGTNTVKERPLFQRLYVISPSVCRMFRSRVRKSEALTFLDKSVVISIDIRQHDDSR